MIFTEPYYALTLRIHFLCFPLAVGGGMPMPGNVGHPGNNVGAAQSRLLVRHVTSEVFFLLPTTA